MLGVVIVILGGYLLVIDQFGDVEGKKFKGVKIFILFESYLVLVLLNLVVLGMKFEKKEDKESDQVFIIVNDNDNVMKDVLILVCMRIYKKVIEWYIVWYVVFMCWIFMYIFSVFEW